MKNHTVEFVQKDNFRKLIVLINLLFQKKIFRSQKFEIVLIDKRPKKKLSL